MPAAGNLAAAGPRPAVLLHGDFHRGNVLAGARVRWLAIDPCPAAGDREYDVATSRLTSWTSRSCPASAGSSRTWTARGCASGCWASASSWALENIAAAGDGEWDLAFARLLLAGPADPGAVRAGPESRA
jgi:aminoglycoside phosphotransferase (APT) family kinase protein